MSTLGPDRVEAYLGRIGIDARPSPTDDALRELHHRHLLTVPFENLSIHLGEPLTLDLDGLYDKIVHRRRGGFCYELNGLFGALLAELGFAVTLYAARVYGEGGPGAPFDHLALDVGGRLCDVGFGRHSAYPIGRDERADQRDPCGTFRVSDAGDGDLDVARDGEPQYRIETHPRALADFTRACWWQEHAPDSHFRARPICSLLTASAGTLSLSGRRLIETEGGERTETDLGDDAAVLAAYRQRFGIVLDRVP